MLAQVKAGTDMFSVIATVQLGFGATFSGQQTHPDEDGGLLLWLTGLAQECTPCEGEKRLT